MLYVFQSLAICDVIYHLKWTTLTEKTKRNLIMIMIRSRRPIELNGASMITMSVNTFVKVIVVFQITFTDISGYSTDVPQGLVSSAFQKIEYLQDGHGYPNFYEPPDISRMSVQGILSSYICYDEPTENHKNLLQ